MPGNTIGYHNWETLETHAVWFPEQVLVTLGESLFLWSRSHTLCWSCNRTGCSHDNVEPHPTESGALESYVGLRSIKMTVLFTQIFHYILLQGTEREIAQHDSHLFICFSLLDKSSALEITNGTDSTDGKQQQFCLRLMNGRFYAHPTNPSSNKCLLWVSKDDQEYFLLWKNCDLTSDQQI